jgi:hypothetical protein
MDGALLRLQKLGRPHRHGRRAAKPGKEQGKTMDELNGRMIACQILITGLIARVANSAKDPLSFLTDFRDEIKAVVAQIEIAGSADSARTRAFAQGTVDELFSLMKPPSND